MGTNRERLTIWHGPRSVRTNIGKRIGLVIDIELHLAARWAAATEHDIARLIIINRVQIHGAQGRQNGLYFAWHLNDRCGLAGLHHGNHRRIFGSALDVHRNRVS